MIDAFALPRPLAAGLGIALDRVVGEPATSWHPLVRFGQAMGALESKLYRDARGPGVLYASAGTAIAVLGARRLRSTTLATTLAVGAHSLHDAARQVTSALEQGDLARARELLPTLVGRDPAGLDESEIARAVIESVGENTVDAIVAPALWASVAGAPGALGYRAINTMDAMVGHHSERYEHFGWASARLDDVANWVPARCTAALVTVVRPRAATSIRRALSTQAPAHPSPNAGVAEAAFAAALGIRLGGQNRYGARVEDRVVLGDGRPPRASDIDASIRLSRDVTTLLAGVLCSLGVARWLHR